MRWTSEKIEYLKEKYEVESCKLLADFFGIKKPALIVAAKRFGLCKINRNKQFKLKNLNQENYLAYYWQGFLMADGYVDNLGRLGLSLAEKDKEHLVKFKDFVGHGLLHKREGISNYGGPYYEYKCMDIVNAKKFYENYSITGKKTYNPPCLKPLDEDWKFLCFFVGFFDGDGCIGFDKRGKTNLMKLECHASWLNLFEEMSNLLLTYFEIESKVSLTNRGFAKLNIYKQASFYKFKDLIRQYKLPILERKWKHENTNN